jgi:hypothetical protein
MATRTCRHGRPLAIAALAAPSGVAAAETTTDSPVLEEVVVTTRKRAQNINDVGIAITAFVELAREHHAMCMLLRLQDADAAQVKHLREAWVMVFSDVVDDESGWRNYLARGVDALFTNDPATLIAFFKNNSTHH